MILESYQDLVECYQEIARLHLELEQKAPMSLLYKLHSAALEAAEKKFWAILDNQVDARLDELLSDCRRQLAKDNEQRQPQLVAPVVVEQEVESCS